MRVCSMSRRATDTRGAEQTNRHDNFDVLKSCSFELSPLEVVDSETDTNCKRSKVSF